MTYIALILEVLLFLFGIYVYAIIAGFITSKDPAKQKRLDEFRKNNNWLRFLGLALAAIMLVNIIFHVQDILN